jgi:predicted KAP-like P-loop ATPase
MWSDNETIRDLVNFSQVAEIAAEQIVSARGEPLSMGISGNWGVGKSSLMKLLRNSLEERDEIDTRFVEFNAWLYQNYDDARAALMEAITAVVVEQAIEKKDTLPKSVLEKAKGLLKRVKKLRLLGLAGSAAVDYFTMGSMTPFVAGGMAAMSSLTDGSVTGEDIKGAKDFVAQGLTDGKSLIGEQKSDEAADSTEETPRKAIQEFRDDLEDTLAKLGITLVVLIDDLDRCLPKTAIATLEAMRLFLFLKHTAFVIAADEGMIRQAVRSHFDGADLDADMVTNYFDKLIQLPIRVPPFGTQEVRAYLMMLFVENDPDLDEGRKDDLRAAVCKRLGRSWEGQRVDKAFMLEKIGDCPNGLLNRLALAERIAPILTTSPKIQGNPRLIKRFLNTLSMRMSMARVQDVKVDEEILVKLLLFERCGDKEAYAELLRSVNDAEDGRPNLLAEKERRARGDEGAPSLEKPWNDHFHSNWLALEPPLSDRDLRGALYVSRDTYPIISRADELSSDAKSVLDMLLKMNSASLTVNEEVNKLSAQEMAQVTDAVLFKARQESSWGTPNILNAMQSIASASTSSASLVKAFFSDVPTSQIKASLAPRLASSDWGRQVLTSLHARDDLTGAPRKAIQAAMKGEE